MAKREVVAIWARHKNGKVKFVFCRQNITHQRGSSKTYSLEDISEASLQRIEFQMRGSQRVRIVLSKTHQDYGHMFYEDTY